ncbi:MAG: hypothetical protein P4L99_21680 [Chthoniobacter sp.]|nr:hypothetical protein [Chthoniobacter sp.]
MISITLPPETLAQIEEMKNMPHILRTAIGRGLNKGLALASGEIIRHRFTGEGPFPASEGRLGVRSNRLRNSIRWNVTGIPGRESGGEPSQIEGNTISGSVGTNVKYMGVHEFGFDGDVQVRPHARKQTKQLQFIDPLKKRRGYTTRTVRTADVQVRAFTRHMHLPERAPIRKGLEENQPVIVREIATSVAQAHAKHFGKKP